MSSPPEEQLQLGPYLGGSKNFAKSLSAKGNRNAAMGVLIASAGRNAPRGVRVKMGSPTSSQSSQFGSVQSGNAVMGARGGVRGFVNKRTGMLRNPNTRSWVRAPDPSTLDELKSTATSIVTKPYKKRRANIKSKARRVQSALSYDPAFGRKVRNLQENINKLEAQLKAANSAGNTAVVSKRRQNINSKTNEIVDLVNAESNRLSKIYKNLGINFNKTPKNKLKSEPGALRRMITRILGTAPKVSFTSSRGPSTRSLAGRAAASARRAQARLPKYGGKSGTARWTAARPNERSEGTAIPLGTS